jgi:hypothetical protein
MFFVFFASSILNLSPSLLPPAALPMDDQDSPPPLFPRRRSLSSTDVLSDTPDVRPSQSTRDKRRKLESPEMRRRPSPLDVDDLPSEILVTSSASSGCRPHSPPQVPRLHPLAPRRHRPLLPPPPLQCPPLEAPRGVFATLYHHGSDGSTSPGSK